jgi:hypothetical protein
MHFLVRRIPAAIRAGLMTFLFLALAQVVLAQSDFFRITILENQPLAQAQQLKTMLEGWGYTPVVIEPTGSTYRVLYGSFPSQAEAEAGKARLNEEGISSQQIVQTNAEPAAPVDNAGRFTIIVESFTQRIDAEKVMIDLQSNGFPGASVNRVGRLYEVRLDEYSLSEATEVRKRLASMNFPSARVQKVEPAAPARSSEPENPSTVYEATQASALSPLITQSDIWKGLSEDQKKQVVNSMLMQQRLSSGDALASQVVDIDKRVANLDTQVKEMITRIETERAKDRDLREQVSAMFKDADNRIKAEQYQEAILIYDQILELDKADSLGQRQSILRYKQAMNSKLAGENYEGQGADIARRVEALKADAERYTSMGTIHDLNRAIDAWAEINRLDAAKNGTIATDRMKALNDQVTAMRTADDARLEESNKSLMTLLLGAGGAVIGVVLLLALFGFFALRRQESKLTEKVQAQLASQMRPMRELGGGAAAGGGMISGGGRSLPPSDDNDSDIFSPRGGGEAEFNADPLGGLDSGNDAPTATASTKNADPFGSDSLGPGGGFDNLFGDTTGGAGTAGNSAPTAQSSAPDDDVFGNLFGSQSTPSAPKAAAPPPPLPKAAPEAKPAAAHADDDHHVPISFGFEDTKSSPADEDTSDLLSMFDAPAGGSSASASSPAGESDNPFEAMFQDQGGSNGATASFDPSVARVDEDTEIPGISLDINDPFAPVASRGASDAAFDFAPSSGTPENDATSTSFAESTDLPSFSFDDITSSGGGNAPTKVMPAVDPTLDSLEGGIALSFEDLPVGRQPAGWEGNYDYATLTVEADTPPRGAHQYLAYRKTEGTGKALFTHPFPTIRGKATIEFDMRCDDKNKFLLGFYIEKDGDFQNSINTKILRSEAQTTPTIHMQGESAPYLLGSWAHIKYVVDLDAGLVNGYIDGTHMARDVPFERNPGSLNTLAIRDNINTTGVLLLNNIRVYTA